MGVATYPDVRFRRRPTLLGRILGLLRPVPLAFLLFPFAFAAQVVTQDERVGVVPYLLLFLGGGWAGFRQLLAPPRPRRSRVSLLDLGVGLFVAFSALQIAVAFAMGAYSTGTAMRWFLINVGSAVVYYHVSRRSSRSEIRAILLAISVGAVVVGIHWVHETYTKMVLQQISRYQFMSAEYTKRRQSMIDNELNPSGFIIYYRAHGLVEKHTSTGATVAIGAFATVALFPAMRRRRLVLVLIAFLIVLSIGQATTAWLAFVFTVIVALYFNGDRRRALAQLRRAAFYVTGALAILLFGATTTDGSRALLAKIVETMQIQATNVVNLDTTFGRMSFVWLYLENMRDYGVSVLDNPFRLLVGQGPEPADAGEYHRGGDVGWLEVLAAYGLPMFVLFFGVCLLTVWRAFRALRRKDLDATARAQLMFGAAVVTILIISLVHYDVLFRKSLHVCFYLGLGLIWRHLHATRRGEVRPPEVTGA
jgi:hypothetical protein